MELDPDFAGSRPDISVGPGSTNTINHHFSTKTSTAQLAGWILTQLNILL
jgi:hypothetical protein